MAVTDAQVDEAIRKLRIAFGVKTTDDLVEEMVSRFLSWKLPLDFAPDAGISFDPGIHSPESPYWPIGTNLLDATQAEELVRHLLGLPE